LLPELRSPAKSLSSALLGVLRTLVDSCAKHFQWVYITGIAQFFFGSKFFWAASLSGVRKTIFG
jgi:hypothetical protein